MLAVAPGRQLRRLNFVPAQRQDAHTVRAEDLHDLILLNDAPEDLPAAQDDGMTRPNGRAASHRGQAARKELFSADELSLGWREMRKAGAGLQNLGNTCFMNSVLQSLVHTPPLAELLLSGGSGRVHNGVVNGFHPIQLARELVSRSLAHTSRSPLAPMNFAKSLRRISRSFRLGRQEDAHEFLIALLDAMHEASIAGLQPKPPPELAQTSFIYRIFGGRMRSQVKCCECGYESNTYDPCIDLSLEITRAQSVKRALERFTQGEALDGANKYKCPRQNKAVRALKRMSVDAAPNVLMIQLKRFEFSFSGHKISKKVDFDLDLDLSPFMSEPPPRPALYSLYGVLVHSGHSVHSGHYYSYVRAPNGMWYICDDTHVAQVAERQVMAQKAYILFYIKQSTTPAGTTAKRPAHAATAAAASGSGAVATPRTQQAAAAAAAAVPMPAMRRQDVRQPQQAVQQVEQEEQLAQQPQALVAAGERSSKKRKLREALAQQQQQQQQQQQPTSPLTSDSEDCDERLQSRGRKRKVRRQQQQGDEEPPTGQQQHEDDGEKQKTNGHLGKKARLLAKLAKQRAAAGVDGRMLLPSPLPRLRPLLISPLPGLAMGRRGARMAEALSLAQSRRPNRLLRLKVKQKEAAAAAAAAAAADVPPLAASTGGGEGAAGQNGSAYPAGSAGNSVVSAPDWPPIKPQCGALAASAGSDSDAVDQQQQQQQQVRRRKRQQVQEQQQEEQQHQMHSASVPAPPASANGGHNRPQQHQQHQHQHQQHTTEGVQAFLRGTRGASGLRLDAWQDLDAAEKRLKAELLRKEAPKKRRVDAYDAEYDRGKTKKVRSARGDEEAPGGGGSGGVNGGDFDAAWRSKQRDGVQTELRGNRKRRSAGFQQQQQHTPRTHHSGGRGRSSGGGRGRHSFGGRGGGRHGGGSRGGGRGGRGGGGRGGKR